ncbi:fibronectin type III domain-containing protein [Chitinophaga vietnamensis]|uniref:fibronectin type III domain-containing protein n=1 Tax=Chitinophaga vietnamensis TaxID=2593957 RepID=UPI001375E6F8|nr:LamG-like jellyroll fold domain-containing protein [Chitinophaga vietnamensis]
MQRFLHIMLGIMLLSARVALAQSVLNPYDPIVRYYTGMTLPQQPPDGQIGKWICTDLSKNMPYNWHTDSLKAYIYKGMAFRLQFPKSYNPAANDGKKYPVFVFFHGRGEAGPITDNELQLYHGGYIFSGAVVNGTFDGFLLYPQNQGGFFGTLDYDKVADILNYMAANNKADLTRVIVNGLSSGGAATWDFLNRYPQLTAAALPMSAAATAQLSQVNSYKFTPVWLFQGAVDAAPTQYTADQVVANARAAGANITYTVYPGVGHGTWYLAWAEPDFFPFMNRANILNPYPLYGRSQFCAEDTINITVGITPGFDSYQWKRNDTIINGATGNSINVTSYGAYAVKALRNGVWSDWSPTPLVVGLKPPTVTPPITTAGLMSNVIPAPDGNTNVSLQLPKGYVHYEWRNAANTVVDTDAVFTTSTAGAYTAKVTELYGCSSNPTAPFLVVNANGPNGPDGIRALTATAISKTQLRLDWTDKANPQYNETFFEVYRGAQPGGPYKLVGKSPADTVYYIDSNLQPNTNYYYRIRPVNNNAAGPLSAEVKGVTIPDNTPPTAPGNLVVNGATTRTSVPLAWTASTDDVGVAGYDVYVNGVKSYSVDSSTRSIIAYGLTPRQTYTFYVVARDASGNVSVPSNQVSANSVNNGLNYKYYESSWDMLPDFNALTPVYVGVTPTPTLSVARAANNFGLLFEGYINITTAGTYYFQLSSDDGSKLYINTPYNYGATPLVNNDGLHGTVAQSGSIYLNAGIYPIAIAYFQKGGGSALSLQWKTGSSGTYVNVPASAFADTFTPAGSTAAAPSLLGAVSGGYNRINLNWTDNSTNESGFEIYRGNTATGAFTKVGQAAAGAAAFTDSLLNANTRYYYKVASINQYGTSTLNTGAPYGAIWPFNGDVNDISYNGNNGTAGSSLTFSSPGKEGAKCLSLDGTANGYVGIGAAGTTGFLHDAFSARTVAMWIKPNSVSGKRILIDMGGSTNGIALRLNGNVLEGAVVGSSSSTRKTIAASATISNNVWTHIAAVYNGSSLKLYVNGLPAGSTTFSSSIGASSDAAAIGKYISQNAFADNTNVLSFSGNIDYTTIINAVLSDSDIVKLRDNIYPVPTAVTDTLPAPPAAPTAATATAAAQRINLSWTDTATNVTGFEIWRSVGNNTSFRFLANTNALARGNSSGTFSDTSIFANQQYSYQVRALNAGGNSAWSNIASATALNNPPVIQAIPDQTSRYDVSSMIPVIASDPDGDSLTYTLVNMPPFITLVQNANGYFLNVAPALSQQGTYYNIKVIVTDGHGGSAQAVFNLIINDNYSPVIDSASNVTMNEGDKQQVTLTATDRNPGDSLTWTGVNLPAFITVNSNNDTCILNLKPGYIDAGTYNVKVQVSDNKGGFDTKTFTLVVNKVDPNSKVFVNLKLWTDAPSPWNNVTSSTWSNLKNDKGALTSINVNIPGSWYAMYAGGPTTGNNSGVVPDAVMQEYLFFGNKPGYFSGPDSIIGNVTGLDTSKTYTFKFFASSIWNQQADNGTTTFRIGNTTVPLAVQNNTTNTANIYNVKPDAGGNITFVANRAPGTAVGYLNSVEIDVNYDDGNPPAAPRNLAATLANGIVQLNWTDVAYNETGYEVYRSTDSAGAYTLVKTAVPNTASIIDSSASGNNSYYYKVRAVNNAGASAYSNIAAITVPNKIPVLDSIADVKMKAQDVFTVSLHAVDDSTDTLHFTATGLPPFAAFGDNGNGTGTITFSPTNDNLGSYVITVRVSDNHGGSSSRTFRLFVNDRNTTLTYFNIAEIYPAPAPWNNINNYPYAGTYVSNALDETGTPNGMTWSINENWTWAARTGVNTGESTGIYSDLVLKTSWYENSTNGRTIVIGGLDNNKRYNFVFFNSLAYGSDATTLFTINGTTVSLNGMYNTRKTVQINGITPSNGQVSIVMQKPLNALANSNAYLNAMVVEAYLPTVPLVSPAGLRADAINGTKVALMWADRSTGETGFQVFRKTSATGTETQIASLPAGSTSYIDSLLTPNQQYFYRVRAVKGSTLSDYSNMASTTTFALNLYVKFSDTTYAPAPWNNTSKRPATGAYISNLADDNGNRTNVGITIINNFAGMYGNPGMTTGGRNAGIYPDVVMKENLVLFPGQQATMKITGLNQSMSYNLTFFASAIDWLDLNTQYTANGNRVTWLNASMDTTGAATIYNVTPDQNGEIALAVNPGPTASYGLLGALVIQGYTPPVGTTTGSTLQPLKQTKVAGGNTPVHAAPVESASETFGETSVYPNPFVNQLNLDIEMKRSSSLFLEIFDLNGRALYRELITHVPQGRSTLRINTGNKITVAGYYLLRITDDQRKQKVFKVIKNM